MLFTLAPKDVCTVDAVVDGLAPGRHAVRIHTSGNLSGGVGTAGPVYNPDGASGDDAPVYGDLGGVNSVCWGGV